MDIIEMGQPHFKTWTLTKWDTLTLKNLDTNKSGQLYLQGKSDMFRVARTGSDIQNTL